MCMDTSKSVAAKLHDSVSDDMKANQYCRDYSTGHTSVDEIVIDQDCIVSSMMAEIVSVFLLQSTSGRHRQEVELVLSTEDPEQGQSTRRVRLALDSLYRSCGVRLLPCEDNLIVWLTLITDGSSYYVARHEVNKESFTVDDAVAIHVEFAAMKTRKLTASGVVSHFLVSKERGLASIGIDDSIFVLDITTDEEETFDE